MPLLAIRTQITSAVNLILQLERMRDGVRRISQVTEVVGLESGVVVMNDIFQYEYEGENSDGTLRGHYKVSRIRPSFMPRLQYFNLDRVWNAALDEGL